MAAEQSLRGFSGNSEFIPQCQLILDSSKSEYALLLASNSLIKLFTKFYTTFTPQQTVEIRTTPFDVVCSQIRATIDPLRSF